jgi:general L-amino acid transport system substrate-binding protein
MGEYRISYRCALALAPQFMQAAAKNRRPFPIDAAVWYTVVDPSSKSIYALATSNQWTRMHQPRAAMSRSTTDIARATAWLLLSAGVWVAAAGEPLHAAAGDTLAKVKTRGTLRCGVSEGIAGFSRKDASGRWSGLDADFCRAVAAAALGDGNKVTFLPLRASARFPALRGGTIDLLVRNTTWTLAREAGLQVRFAGVLFYDGQGFMVPAKSRIKSLAQLKGATVCVEKGTTTEENMEHYSQATSLGIKALVLDSVPEAAKAFFAGRCAAMSGDAATLVAVRADAPGGSQAFVILPERISKEPLAPAVRAEDENWLTLVRWVLNALVAAEELGITSQHARERLADPSLERGLRATEEVNRALGTAGDWPLRVVASVGNYGEMFERNVGQSSPLRLERGLNAQWTQGGLMYSPPFR